MNLESYRGDGPYLSDGTTTLLDCASGTFNLALGYSSEPVISALKEQLDRCAHLSSEFTKPFAADLLRALRPYLPPGLSACWLRDITGSTAVEGAIRVAQKATGRSEVVSLFLSHHGQSLAATSISGNAFRRASFASNGLDSLKIPAPACKSCFYEKSPKNCDLFCARSLEGYLEYASIGNTAAIVIEPVMGNGGNVIPPPGYFSKLRDICTRRGILIIADEVQTGFGRTGTMFASSGFARDLDPDILVFGKGAGGVGIPVAGFFMRPNLDVLESWEHSVTSGFNPLAIVAMRKTIETIEKQDLLGNARERGRELVTGLRAFAERHPGVLHPCGVGLMCAFDLAGSDEVAAFIEAGRRNGLLLRGSRYGRGNTIKVRPPLIVEEAHVAEILDRLEATICEIESEGRTDAVA